MGNDAIRSIHQWNPKGSSEIGKDADEVMDLGRGRSDARRGREGAIFCTLSLSLPSFTLVRSNVECQNMLFDKRRNSGRNPSQRWTVVASYVKWTISG